METRAQALRKSVIPAKAGIHFNPKALDSRFRGNDGLKETIYLSFVRHQDGRTGGRENPARHCGNLPPPIIPPSITGISRMSRQRMIPIAPDLRGWLGAAPI